MKPSTIYTTTKSRPNGERLTIQVRMDDECNNGHADFAITATLYDKHGRGIAGGCMHEEIAKASPKLQPFIDVHLNDATTGAPMHALANGWYFYELAVGRREDQYKPAAYYAKAAQDHLFLSDSELSAIIDAKLEEQDHFQWYIEREGIPARWKAKAEEARELIFSLCKDPEAERAKWTDYAPTRIAYEAQTSEKREAMQKRLADGYYTDEAKAKRAHDAKEARKAAVLAGLAKEHKEATAKLDTDYMVKVAVVQAGGDRHGWIYYDHTNQLVANWSGCGHVSRAAYEAVLANIHNFPLPEGIEIEYKAK